MNLAEIMSAATDVYNDIQETSMTSFEWWSASEEPEFGVTTEWTTERHFLFPTIKMYLSPIQDQDSMVIPFKFDQVSHQGSIARFYVTDPNLAAVESDEVVEVNGVVGTKPADINWKLKRFDKLVSVEWDSETFYVVDVYPSSAGTHAIVGLIGSNLYETNFNPTYSG